MSTTRLPRCLLPEDFVAARPRRLKWSGAGFSGPRAYGTRRGRRASGIVHIPPPGDSSNLLEARRRTRRAPIVALTDAGSPSPCIVHIDGRRRHHRLIPVAHRYPLGLKQSPGVKAHPRPRNPRLEAAPGGEELDRERGAVDSCRLAAFARNHHRRRSSKSPAGKVHPDLAPAPGAETTGDAV